MSARIRFASIDSYSPPKRFENVFSGPQSKPSAFLRPKHRTILIRRDGKTLDLLVSDRKHALFNPARYSASVNATWGTLNPIGWTHPARQYAYTESIKTQISLAFDAVLMQHLKYTFDKPQDMGVWFQSFVYPPKPGSPPDILHLRTPGFSNTDWIVETYSIKIEQWFHDGTPRLYFVDLNLSEFRDPRFINRHTDSGPRSPDFFFSRT